MTQAQQPADGWIQEGPLLYCLTDDRKPKNRDEISVTMADGSRTEEARTRRAGELLDAIRAAAAHAVQPAVPVAETCEICQGNGEIVTDWPRYQHPHVGDKGDEAVSACQECNGTGQQAPAHPAEGVPAQDMVSVKKEDANAFCRILTALGMEEKKATLLQRFSAYLPPPSQQRSL